MKKIYILLFVLACSVGYLQAQGWYVYDGSDNPANLDGWTTSSNNPGPNMVEEVLDDPQIDGNKVFRYVQPDELSIPGDATARKLYRRDFDAPIGDGQVTIVTRLMGYGVDTLPIITEIQVHNSANSYREYLQVDAVDSLIKLQRADVQVKVDADLNGWHVYRFVLDGTDSTATVYLDEDPTPVISGKNGDGTSNDYLRFGDGGSARTAGYMDWMIVDTTGAYAPGEGAAIPDSLSTESGSALPAFGKNLLFITRTDQVGPTGNYPDTLFVVDLKNAGFNVTVPDYSIVADASPELVAAADAADIVIIGRAVSSGDFQQDPEKDFWNSLQKPVIVMSNYLVRNSRLDWIASSSTLNYARFGDLPGKVHMPDDPAFDGVAVPPADSILVYAVDNIGMIEMSDSVQNINNGEVLISLINGPEAYEVSSSAEEILDTVQLSEWDGNPLMIRWAPLDTMYDGGAVTPYGWRTFMTGGDDHDWDNVNMRRNIATYVFSPELNQVLLNECLYLLELPQPEIDDDATLSALEVSEGTLDPAFDPAVNNYVVTLPAGTTTVTITATANSENASVAGDGEFTDIPGTAVITVTSQAGTENVYNIVFQLEPDDNDDCLAGGTGTLEAAIAAAAPGDTITLCNDAVYSILQPITIDKKIVIRSLEWPTLPDLANMPLIDNQFAINPIFQLADGAELHLIGIDIDGGGAANIINPRPGGLGLTVAMHINRCRLHNTSSDLIYQADASQETVLAYFTLMNSFLYESGAGHGAYVRNFYGTNEPYVFRDVTFWSLGQQFIWVSHNTGDGDPQVWTFDHMTGYNLSTDLGENKELFGNSDAAGPIDLSMTNTILSTQVSTNEASLAFYQTSASGDVITLSNLVLHDVQPVVPRAGSDPTPVDPLYEADPQFADPANGDFTVGNTDYHTAGDNGSILGARYWAPGFVDDLSDVGTSVNVVEYADMEVRTYPQPFQDELNLEFTLDKPELVTITILDVSGRTVGVFNDSYSAGNQHVTLNLSNLDTGMYFYSIQAGTQTTSGRLVKSK